MRNLFAALVFLSAPAFADNIAPLSTADCAAMKAHHVLNDGAPVGCARLATVTFTYVDFEGRSHDDGRVVVLDALAPRVLKIFQEMKAQGFPISKARPVEAYEGSDDASMADDNTSSFNHRPIAGSNRLSLHAYGAAIDINPRENPYLTFSGATVTVAPPQGAGFLNRLQQRPGKPARPGMAESVVAIFTRNGFSNWGGFWDEPIDYQHFDITRALAERLASLPPEEARAAFEQMIAVSSAP
ncbi:hypothetical protein FHS83_003338 [Rhizomicrobium palustre]|uniref:Peptidase M15C domain-containing protein n=1 Tax=Rhizomicrobium palustre TaxID=189966 RepID=A0A846N4Q8_9PROT|nr:M15 family metallopeptidase [Rhizomicrobium palustre]NIK90020.1 hypothetical protein [Rhizomicrobium palustre]